MEYLNKILKKLFSMEYIDYRRVYYILGLKLTFSRIPRITKKEKFLPIKNNRIVFRTFNSEYCCNIKYIAEEIIKQKLPYELYWIINKPLTSIMSKFPKEITLVNEYSRECLEVYSTAKLWIENDRRVKFIKSGINKKDGQIYIQTWHGSMGIKKTGADISSVNRNSNFSRISNIDNKQIDYFIANSNWVSNFFKNTFNKKATILKFGHPRNDIFFKDNSIMKANFLEKNNLKKDTKICLYAPTWRDDYKQDYYSLNYNDLLSVLKENYGENWCIMTRFHPRLLDLIKNDTFNGKNVIDVTTYPDMQELLAVSDILISDYSSCMFDFMLSRRPVFVYATDIKKYNTERGLYYPLETTPFPISINNKELFKNITNFDYETYKQNVEDFLNDKGCIENGKASDMVVKKIKSLIEE